MSIFKRNKFKTVDDGFSEPQPISGGNSFNVYQQLKIQKDIDLQTLQNNQKSNNLMVSLREKIDNISKNLIDVTTFNPYYLLQLHGNYFCNTLKFKSNNPDFSLLLYKLIRVSFLFGRSALVFDSLLGKAYGGYVAEIRYNLYNEVEYIKIGNLDDALINQTGELNSSVYKEYWGEDCKNVLVFNWGTLALSAWVIIYPFCKQQQQLLKMLVGQSFSYNKKFIYKINNPNALSNELDLFYNVNNPFIISLMEDDLSNKFDTFDNNSGDTLSFIEYYKEFCGIMYHLLGRQVNLDNKKERNVSSEVEANQNNFSIVQNDYINQFKCFIEQINKVSDKLQYNGLQLEYEEVINDDVSDGDNSASNHDDFNERD